MNRPYCQACFPSQRRSHFWLWLDYYLEKISSVLFAPFQSLDLSPVWILTLEALALIGAVKYVDHPDEGQIFNRSLIFFREAKSRGLNIKVLKFFGRYKQEFKFSYRGKDHYYETIPLVKNPSALIDDKARVKKLLAQSGLPVAQGSLFTNTLEALAFAKTLGFPLVVKPNRGSLSCHSTYPVNSREELEEAIALARQYRPDFLIEKYIPGQLYRATVAGRHVFVCRKERPSVRGDGSSSIRQLVEEKNLQPGRGELEQKNTTLHKIPISEALENYLRAQGLKLNSILPKGRKIYLSSKFILAAGCEIINLTHQTHPHNKMLFLKVARLLGSDLLGIDFICQEISRSYHGQQSAILETNTIPYLDMHMYPSQGQPDRVAEMVWDAVLEKLKKL